MELFEIKSSTQQILLNGLPLTDLSTVLTFFLLVLTIIVSVRALKETARSNVLSSSPVLVLKYFAAEDLENTLRVENVGHGVALNIRVESFHATFLDDIQYRKAGKLVSNRPIHAVLKVEPVDLLLEGKTVSLDLSKSRGGGMITSDLVVYEMMKQKKEITLRLRYSDITGVSYISKVKISQNRIRVGGCPKKYSIIRKVAFAFYLCFDMMRLLIFRVRAEFDQRKVNQELGNL